MVCMEKRISDEWITAELLKMEKDEESHWRSWLDYEAGLIMVDLLLDLQDARTELKKHSVS